MLGEEHPDTLTAMANLAFTRMGLNQNDLAIELMSRSANLCPRVLGNNHPVCVSRHDQIAIWSGTAESNKEYNNGDSEEDVHSSEDGGIDLR